MSNHRPHCKEELDDLKQELEHFQKEKERVRTIIGRIGGVPTQHTKIINVVFLVVVIVAFGLSLIFHNSMIGLAMSELGVAAISIKLLMLINNQGRVNHFQLWILSAIEWRLDELRREIKELHEPPKEQEPITKI